MRSTSAIPRERERSPNNYAGSLVSTINPAVLPDGSNIDIGARRRPCRVADKSAKQNAQCFLESLNLVAVLQSGELIRGEMAVVS